MKSLILRNNSFYGIIPIEIGDLQDIKMLDLGYNNFRGPIPSELQNIVSLEFLFLEGNRFSGGLPVGLHKLARISENQDINWLNRVPTARFATIRIRRLLVSKQKDSETIHIPEHRGRLSPLLDYPLAPSPAEPISPSPASPPIEHTPSQENKNNHSPIIYASVGAAVGFLVVALSAVCFFYYCRRKTSTVVPLFAPTTSTQLQTTAMEGWLMC
jgi:hypothetical protein